MVYHHHRPLHAMYGDNYRYGTSLYGTSSAGDIERNYRSSLALTHVRSDRGDLGMYSFAGSNIHGGAPAAYAGSMSTRASRKAATHDLYAPLSFGYGRSYYDQLRFTPDSKTNYYDHLRATTPEPRISKKTSSYTSLYDEADYLKKTSKSTSDYDSDVKKTITTTTERWVPLTTYIYNSPYHTYYYSSSPYSSRTYRTTDDIYSYNYVDDYKRDSSYTTKSKNIEALDLSVSSAREKFDYNHWSSKCQEIQSQLDQVNQWVAEAESRLKTDLVGARHKMHAELSDVALVVEDTTKYNEELQRVIKRQARQITDLSSQSEDINRHLLEVSDTLEKTRLRCQTLSGELASVQTGMEMALKRR